MHFLSNSNYVLSIVIVKANASDCYVSFIFSASTNQNFFAKLLYHLFYIQNLLFHMFYLNDLI